MPSLLWVRNCWDSCGIPDNQKSLVAILQYHIILGVFTSPDLVDGGILDTRNRRRSVEVSVGILDTRNRRRSVEVSVGDTLMFNQANVVRRNGVNGVASDSMLANNGVLLKIDAVMNPDSLNGF
jgi:uncharacterized surface protein with fasciclin (FAS1) repeats